MKKMRGTQIPPFIFGWLPHFFTLQGASRAFSAMEKRLLRQMRRGCRRQAGFAQLRTPLLQWARKKVGESRFPHFLRPAGGHFFERLGSAA
jgi:hypothetical protein